MKEASTADNAAGVAIALAAVLEMAAPATPFPPVKRSAAIAAAPPTKVVITPSKIPGRPPSRIWPKLMLAPKQKPTTIMMAVIPFERTFFMYGKAFPNAIPKTSGNTVPTKFQIEMFARPALLNTAIVTIGPTLSVVIPTAPASISSPYTSTIPAYIALLATEMAPITATALSPRKLSLNTFATNNPKTTDTAIFAKIIAAPRPTAFGVFLREMVPPIMKRNAPTSGPAPFTIGVVNPPICNI